MLNNLLTYLKNQDGGWSNLALEVSLSRLFNIQVVSSGQVDHLMGK